MLAIAVSGCGGGLDLTGKWTGRREGKIPEGGNPVFYGTILRVELTVHEDGRFDLFEGGIPKSGSIRYSGGKAYLKIDTVMDQPIERAGEAVVKANREIELTSAGKNRIEYKDPGGFDSTPVILRKQPQP